ncbi:MAG: hypothetical protein Q9227_000674 [Pyrenula ochraceoflavens]
MADPLSIAASALTLLAAVSATVKGLKTIASLKNIPGELYQVHNEISDFHVVITTTTRILQRLLEVDNSDIVNQIHVLIERAIPVVNELQALLRDRVIKNYEAVEETHVRRIEVSKLAWLKHQNQVRRLVSEIQRIRALIDSTLILQDSQASRLVHRRAQANFSSRSTLPEFRVELSNIKIVNTAMTKSLQEMNMLSQRQSNFMENSLVPWMQRLELHLGQYPNVEPGNPYKLSGSSSELGTSESGRNSRIAKGGPLPTSSTAQLIQIDTANGNVRGIQKLFSEGHASIYDVSAGEGRSAVHFALTAGKSNVLEFLILHGASVDVEDKYQLSAVDCIWNYLLEDDTDPITVALRSSLSKYLDEAEDLQKRGFSPLHRIVFGLYQADLEMVLKLGTADIDKKCSLGRSPLCWAALRKDPVPVQTLVKFGASLTLADWRGQTPLHFAAETGSFGCLKIILDAAAQSKHPYSDQEKDNLLSWGESGDPGKPWATSEHYKELLEAKDYKGRSALHFAVRSNNLSHASLLLHHGAAIDSPDAVLDRPPILIAIYWNHHDVLQLLLHRGARVDVMDRTKMTVIHYAAKFGNSRTIALLDEVRINGVSTDCRSSDGRTPLETFDEIRVVSEDEGARTECRDAFEKLIKGIESQRYLDCDADDLDMFFDAASSLEASLEGSIESLVPAES